MHDDIVYMSVALLLQYCDYSVISYHHRCHNHCNPCRHHRLHQCHGWSLSSSCLFSVSKEPQAVRCIGALKIQFACPKKFMPKVAKLP